MCGILGGLNVRFSERALDRLAHRGPDQRSWDRIVAGPDVVITMAQTRLAIVDKNVSARSGSRQTQSR